MSLLFCVAAWPFCTAQEHARQYQFEKYPANVYDGPIKVPEGLHQDKDGAWRDALEKLVADPEVTFAGEYYLAGHSCGAGCRYYELTNLRTGSHLKDVDQFDATEERPRTPDGHPYLTILYAHPNSRLLIAEYLLDFDDPQKTETCRQQYFVLGNRKLRAISKVLPFCTGAQQH
jgi:hypothetical protein